MDENGRLHYGENPPQGAKATPLQREAMPAGKPRAPEDFASEDADFKRRQIQRQQAEDQAAEQERRRRTNCASAQQRLYAMENARRPFRTVNGERVYLTDEERAAQTAQRRAEVGRFCG